MPEGKKNFKNVVNTFKALSTGKKIGVVAVCVGCVLGALFIVMWAQEPVFEVLYSNLEQADAGAVVERLKSQKVPYKVVDNGRTILVPKERVYELRLQMASQGIPSGGTVGFEVFDKAKLGITEFAQQVNYQRALQGELARTIQSLAAVESARVHIVLPKKSVFLEREEPASCSVVLKLRSAGLLKDEQIQGIIHLVSSSVPGLKPENVSVLDTQGKLLAGAGKETQKGFLTSEQLEYQQRFEKYMEEKIKGLLGQVLGPDKAIVKISTDMDFSRVERLEELYDPEKVAVRSEQSKQTLQGGKAQEAQTPVAVVPVEPKAGPQTASSSQDSSKTVNYEVSKTVRKVLEPTGVLKKISVAVVVDGTYKITKTKKGETQEYVPRTEKELDSIKELVKGAVNFDQSRGDVVEVVNLPFQGRPTEKEAAPGLLERIRGVEGYLKYVVAFIGLFLLYRLVMKPILNWLTKAPSVDAELVKQLPLTVKELEAGYGAKQAALAETLKSLLTQERDAGSQVLKSWVGEEA